MLDLTELVKYEEDRGYKLRIVLFSHGILQFVLTDGYYYVAHLVCIDDLKSINNMEAGEVVLATLRKMEDKIIETREKNNSYSAT